jgi:hypothetical protein
VQCRSPTTLAADIFLGLFGRHLHIELNFSAPKTRPKTTKYSQKFDLTEIRYRLLSRLVLIIRKICGLKKSRLWSFTPGFHDHDKCGEI